MSEEQYRTLSPPKFIAEHWPKHLEERDRDLIEEFLEFVGESENGGVQLMHFVRRCHETHETRDWEEAPLPELMESFFNARETL